VSSPHIKSRYTKFEIFRIWLRIHNVEVIYMPALYWIARIDFEALREGAQ